MISLTLVVFSFKNATVHTGIYFRFRVHFLFVIPRNKKNPRLYCSLILSSHFKNKFKIVSYLFQFCHRIFTLWDSMYEAGRCRTFNILVGFPHKITNSNHSRHFEADFFFTFFLSFKCDFFLKSKNKLYLYTKH